MNQEEPRMAREIGPVGPAPDGAYVVTTFSQAQIDSMLSSPGEAWWISSPDELTLGFLRGSDSQPMATFDLQRNKHRRALQDVLKRGTLILCAIDSLNERTGHLEGANIAIDIAPADRLIIESALKGIDTA